MKTFGVFAVMVACLLGLIDLGTARAQQPNSLPPILVQPQVAPPAAPGQVPPPPPPGQMGISVVQSIPESTLLGNLPRAIETVSKIKPLLRPGKVWMIRAPGGEIEMKAGILYQSVVIAVLHLNPLNGSVLPEGLHPREYRTAASVQTIKAALPALVKSLVILPDASFLEPESCWSFPVAWNGMIVAHIKIFYDGTHVVQDYPANQEMNFYGQ